MVNTSLNKIKLVKLVDFQNTHKLHAANKLTSRHTDFFNKITNVRLAAQTLSQSVSDFLKYLPTTESVFKRSLAAAELCSMIHNASNNKRFWLL